ncbi:MAG: acyl-CoA dehydrogenase family protein [Actinomycetota bacterium]
MGAEHLEDFRADVARFLAESQASGIACPAFGAIVPPDLFPAARAWQAHCFAEGWAALHWPVEHGGRGLSRAHTAVWFEECARAEVAPYLNLQGLVLAAEAILRSGSEAQKSRFLPATASAEVVWCQLFSEPGAGSDLGGLQSRAVRDGDNYVLNGQKVWCSNGQFADFGILMARTSTDLPKHKGISFFLFDMTLDGTEVRPLRQMTGDEEFCEVFFTDVALPADALLGAENEGWRVAMEVLGDERGAFGEAGVISFEHRLAEVADLDAADPVARDTLAALVAAGGALGSFLRRAGDDPRLAPAAKLMRTELDADANELAAGLRGAEAMLAGDETDRLLYSPGMRIAGGSSEIQRNILGERVLGLPREPT